MEATSPARSGPGAANPAVAPVVTWVGHATALVDIGGFRILTDPLLTTRVAHLRRRVGPALADVADVDVVLLSHVHMDHLHVRSLRRVRPGAVVLAPRGSARLVRKLGFEDVREVGPGERVDVGGATIVVVEAHHSHRRGPHSRIEAPAVGYVVEAEGTRVYFAGDTDLFDGMRDLGDIDLALVPIWGWGPSADVGHLDPSRAAEAVDRIRPRLVVPIHWGTFTPESGRRRLPRWFDAPAPAFVDALDALGHGDRLDLVEPGGAVSLERPAR
ncbi:MAG: MBL fold metallo-hydrolase [Actinomycetota bacterium]|nr:MBL fold metallo-hydrolase [Actinomycetota bacterium]